MLVLLLLLSTTAAGLGSDNQSDDASVELFRRYLRINTGPPHPEFGKAVEFWKLEASQIGLPVEVLEFETGFPIIIIKWIGLEPDLPAIMLNSHMDVVAADATAWTYPPFEAAMDEEGKIYARGTQDMKSVGIQYFEAIKRLISNGTKLKRSIILTLMPDEETGGFKGMMPFVKSDCFKKLNIGFALDEGLASNTDQYMVFYVDKRPWQIKLICRGNPGHGGIMADSTAAEKFGILVREFLKFRDSQKKIMKSREATDYGSYTTVNLNIVKGGVATNIIPAEMNATFDMRLGVDVNASMFEEMVQGWLAKAGDGVSYHYERQIYDAPATPLDESNKFWKAFQNVASEMKITLLPRVCPATSDMSYVRPTGIPALGFSPMSLMAARMHGNDEYLSKKTFLNGIYIYEQLIPALANVD